MTWSYSLVNAHSTASAVASYPPCFLHSTLIPLFFSQDDSTSMISEDGHQRITALKHILYQIGQIYIAVRGRKQGIRAVRFLNSIGDFNPSDLSTLRTIGHILDKHHFKGLARLGTGLMEKILKPFVFVPGEWDEMSGTPRELNKLERPLLIMTITAGVGWMLNAFVKCAWPVNED